MYAFLHHSPIFRPYGGLQNTLYPPPILFEAILLFGEILSTFVIAFVCARVKVEVKFIIQLVVKILWRFPFFRSTAKQCFGLHFPPRPLPTLSDACHNGLLLYNCSHCKETVLRADTLHNGCFLLRRPMRCISCRYFFLVQSSASLRSFSAFSASCHANHLGLSITGLP